MYGYGAIYPLGKATYDYENPVLARQGARPKSNSLRSSASISALLVLNLFKLLSERCGGSRGAGL